jgi:hypothetical protein
VQLNDFPTHAPEVVSRLIEGEALLVHPQQGVVRVLNDVGARLWELADGRSSVAAMADVIASEYAVDAAHACADALVFLTDLVHRGVLIAA